MALHRVTSAFATFQKKVKEFQGRIKSRNTETDDKNVPLPAESGVQRAVVELSVWSAFKIILLIFTAYLAFSFLERITSILVLLFISAFFATALNPGVDRLEKVKIPRGIGTILLMILVLSIFLGILGGVIPVIGNEVGNMWEGLIEFAKRLSQEDFSGLPNWLQGLIQDVLPPIRDYLTRVSPEELQTTITNFAKDNLSGYIEQVGNVAGKGLSLIFTIFGGIFQTLLFFILTFFLVVEKGSILTFFVHLFPAKYEAYLSQKAKAVQGKIAEWVHGQIILFLVISGIAYIGLSLIGVKYALTLALIAGLGEFTPYVGPIIAFASAAPVAFNQSFSIGIATMLFYIGIQMVDGNIIIPLIMRKTVGISPVVTIISMLIGWEFLGILGMVLAVPVASVVSLFVSDYSERDPREMAKAVRGKR